MEKLKFLTRDQIDHISKNFQLPVFVYSESELKKYAQMFLDFPNAYGLLVRYAMKASSNRNILKIFNNMGVHLDASSGNEVIRAVNAGVDGSNIQLTAQEFPDNIEELMDLGIIFNACSLNQLEKFGQIFPGTEISIRINPGLGTGGTNRTNVGGPSSSFGIWYEHIDKAKGIASKYNLKITKLHTHIGSGGDPKIWASVSQMSLDAVKNFPDVHTLNLGGGLKIGRMSYEESADLEVIGNQVKKNFEKFANEDGRQLKLEIEPGTYLVANSCAGVTRIIDVVDTGENGYNFIKVNSGMTEITRPSMYGSQHPMIVINDCGESMEYIVAGHCCESGDIWTPKDGDPEGLDPRELNKANIGDILVIEGSGAYCSTMSTKNYNSFPEAAELLIKEDGDIVEIRKRQKLEQIWQNEVDVV